MDTTTELEKENRRDWFTRWGYLLISLSISLGFALVFFIPFSQTNLQFGRQLGEMFFNFSPVLALLYFGIVGLLIAVLRKQIARLITNQFALLIDFIVVLVACTATTALGFWLLNGAVPCMLEMCGSHFLQSCGLATFAFAIVMALSWQKPSTLLRWMYSDGCVDLGGCLILLISAVIGVITVYALMHGMHGDGC